jgi:RNA polymerase sigma-70 factor, ECF subfamily
MRVLDDRVEALPCQNPTQANLMVAMTAEEQRLLQRVIQHDEEAFNALYARYAPQVRRFLSRRLARHILIDVMLMLWQHAAKVPQTVPLGAWLCGVARRKAYKALAYAATAPGAPVTSEHLDADDPELVLLQQEHRGILARVLDALPPGERIAIQLMLSQGCSYQEIAAATGDLVSTIRTRVSRAYQRLQLRIAALESSPSSPSSLTSSQQIASVSTSRRQEAW